jgi:uncharacterized protein (TIGR03083 family)
MAWDDIRATAHAAAESAAALVELLSKCDLATPALGAWDVRGLAGHLLRAIRTPLDLLAQPEPTDTPLPAAASYYAAYLAWREPDPARSDAAVGARGDAEFPRHTIGEIQDSYRATVDAFRSLDQMRGDRLLPTAFGSMRLEDYVRTRILEMVTHTLDLARAVGEQWEVPGGALADALGLLTEIAIETGTGPQLLAELTGRDVSSRALPVLQ